MAIKLEGGGGLSGRATKKIPLFFAASLTMVGMEHGENVFYIPEGNAWMGCTLHRCAPLNEKPSDKVREAAKK